MKNGNGKTKLDVNKLQVQMQEIVIPFISEMKTNHLVHIYKSLTDIQLSLAAQTGEKKGIEFSWKLVAQIIMILLSIAAIIYGVKQ